MKSKVSGVVHDDRESAVIPPEPTVSLGLVGNPALGRESGGPVKRKVV